MQLWFEVLVVPSVFEKMFAILFNSSVQRTLSFPLSCNKLLLFLLLSTKKTHKTFNKQKLTVENYLFSGFPDWILCKYYYDL